MSALKVDVIVGLVNRLSAPLRSLSAEARRAVQGMAVSGAAMAGAGAGLLAPLTGAAAQAAALSSSLVEVGIVADVAAARLATIRPELRAMARDANQTIESLAGGLKDLTAKGLSLPAALAALPAIGRTATAAKAELTDMAAASSSLIQNLGIAPERLQRSLDILTVAGNAGAFELKDMAREFPSLTAAAAKLGLTGEEAVSSLGAALQVAMKGAGTAPEAANNVLNLLSKLTSPETVGKMKKEWGVDMPAAYRRWVAQGLNPVEQSLALIQQHTQGDAFKIGEIFGDMQVNAALTPLLANIQEYRRIKEEAAGGMGASLAQFNRRVGEDPTERWKRLQIVVNNLADRIGTVLLPVFERLEQRLTPILDRVGAWIDANPALTKSIAMWGAVIGAVVIALGALGLVLSVVGVGIGGLAAVLGTIFSPAGLAVVAVVGALIVAYRNWGAICTTVTETVGAAWAWIKKQFDWDPLAAIGEKWRAFSGYIDNLFGGWPRRAYEWGAELVAGWWRGIKDKFASMLSWFGSLAARLPDWMQRLLGIGAFAAVDVPAVPAGPASAVAAAQRVVPEALARVIIPPRRAPDAAPASASRSAPAAADRWNLFDWLRSQWGRLTGWLSGRISEPLALLRRVAGPAALAAQMASAPAAAAVPVSRPAPQGLSMPITINLTIPPGSDATAISAMVERAVDRATRQAGRRLSALYDGSDVGGISRA